MSPMFMAGPATEAKVGLMKASASSPDRRDWLLTLQSGNVTSSRLWKSSGRASVAPVQASGVDVACAWRESEGTALGPTLDSMTLVNALAALA